MDVLGASSLFAMYYLGRLYIVIKYIHKFIVLLDTQLSTIRSEPQPEV